MAYKANYKVRIKTKNEDGVLATRINFELPIAERMGCDSMNIEARNGKLWFDPDPNGAYKCRPRIDIRAAAVAKAISFFDGEYLAFVKGENGSYYLDAADKLPLTNDYKSHTKSVEPTEPEKPKAKSTYVNPYLVNTAQTATLRGIIYAQDARIEQLNKDIVEAEKLLAELRAERDNLVGIQTRAEELITLLGGKK